MTCSRALPSRGLLGMIKLSSLYDLLWILSVQTNILRNRGVHIQFIGVPVGHSSLQVEGVYEYGKHHWNLLNIGALTLKSV